MDASAGFIGCTANGMEGAILDSDEKYGDGAVSAHDVIIVGAGAGALLTATRATDLGLSVLVVEKSDKYGGTSATSGGSVWVPNHGLGGVADSFDAAFAYMRAATGGRVAEARLRAYLETAPRMVAYLMEHTRLRYAVHRAYPDSYQDLPGALPGGRTLDPWPFDARLLGETFDDQRVPTRSTLLMGRIGMTAIQAHTLLAREHGWIRLIVAMLLRYGLDFPWRFKTVRDRRLTLGSALVAGLRHALLERGVPLWLNTPFEDLIVADGRVAGIVVRRAGQSVHLRARKGVVLAAGGFERNPAMREQYLPQPTNAAWSATPPHNTGDALRAAMALGARTDLLDWAWWVPTVKVPELAAQQGLYVGRAFPGCIAVNRQGRRFVNEAAQYLEFGAAMYRERDANGAAVNIPAWLIFDARFRRAYPIGPLLPGKAQPDGWLDPSWRGQVYWKDGTITGLARQIGVDAAGLEETVRRNNADVECGVDTAFGKGVSLYDRFYGDAESRPNPCLGPIGTAPFYAIRVDPGDVGTKGGLLTDADACVLGADGQPIAGLFCIGNNSASVMGTSHPGAGGTLGPALTFGFRAAEFLARA